jgi:hypothetical protein
MARALQARRLLAFVFTVALTLSACGGFDRDINVVKQSNAPTGIANEELVRQIAGARGKCGREWIASAAREPNTRWSWTGYTTARPRRSIWRA